MINYLIFLFIAFSGLLNAAELGDENLQPGPNCYQFALSEHKMVTTNRYVSPEEFSEKLKQNCQQVNAPRKGDIGLIKNFANPQHAFIYLAENLAIERANLLQGTKVAQANYLDFFNEKRYVDCPDDTLVCRWQLEFYTCKNVEAVKPSSLEMQVADLASSASFDYQRAVSLEKYLRENRESITPNLYLSLIDQLDFLINGL